jgi:hypothetical protein
MDSQSFDDTGALVLRLGVLFEALTGEPFSYTDFEADELYVMRVIETALSSEHAQLRNIAAHLRTRLLGSVETIVMRDADPLARTRRHAILALPAAQAQAQAATQVQAPTQAPADARAKEGTQAKSAAQAQAAAQALIAQAAAQRVANAQRDAELLAELAALADGTLEQDGLYAMQLVETALQSDNPAVRHAAAHTRMGMDLSVEVITLRDSDPLARTRRLQPLRMPDNAGFDLVLESAAAQEVAAPEALVTAPAPEPDTTLLPGLAAIADGTWDKGELLALQLIETALVSANPVVREAAAGARAGLDFSFEEIEVHEADPLLARARGYTALPLTATGPREQLVLPLPGAEGLHAGAVAPIETGAPPLDAAAQGEAIDESLLRDPTAEELALIAELDALTEGRSDKDGLAALQLVEEARFAGHAAVREAALRAQARLLESMEVIDVDEAGARVPARQAAAPRPPGMQGLASADADLYEARARPHAASSEPDMARYAQGAEALPLPEPVTPGLPATQPAMQQESEQAIAASGSREPNDADLALLEEINLLRAAPALAGGLRALQLVQEALQSSCAQVRVAGEHLHTQLLGAMESITLSDDTTQRPPRRGRAVIQVAAPIDIPVDIPAEAPPSTSGAVPAEGSAAEVGTVEGGKFDGSTVEGGAVQGNAAAGSVAAGSTATGSTASGVTADGSPGPVGTIDPDVTLSAPQAAPPTPAAEPEGVLLLPQTLIPVAPGPIPAPVPAFTPELAAALAAVALGIEGSAAAVAAPAPGWGNEAASAPTSQNKAASAPTSLNEAAGAPNLASEATEPPNLPALAAGLPVAVAASSLDQSPIAPDAPRSAAQAAPDPARAVNISMSQVRQEVASALDALFEAPAPRRAAPVATAGMEDPLAMPAADAPPTAAANFLATSAVTPDPVARLSIPASPAAVPPLPRAPRKQPDDGRPDPGRRKQFLNLLAELEDLCARDLQYRDLGGQESAGLGEAAQHAATRNAAGPAA